MPGQASRWEREMVADRTVEIGVHERIDSKGYVVKITASLDGRIRVARWPVDDRVEADAIAVSVRDYVEGGGDVAIFVPDDEDGE